MSTVQELFKYLMDFLTPSGAPKETPRRMEEAWRFWMSGYNTDIPSLFKIFKVPCNQMIFQGGIPIYSMCEHHGAPFFGVAHVGYIPHNGNIIGLSKIPRLIEAYSRRMTVQERITQETADAIMKYLKPIGVGVVLQCRHLCMESRGVQKPGTITITSNLQGCIKDEPEARAEFLQFVNTATAGLRPL